MHNVSIRGIAAVALIGLSLATVPAAATPIPGIDAPLASSGVQKGYGSGAKTNFGSGKGTTKSKIIVNEK